MSRLRKWFDDFRYVVTIFSLLGIGGWITLYINWDEWQTAKNKYEDSKRADLRIGYFARQSGVRAVLKLTNVGDRQADSIWLSQKIFLVTDRNDIFECELPRFIYALYDGSSRRMFDLGANADTSIEHSLECFYYFSGLLLNRQSGQLVVRWLIEYNHSGIDSRESEKAYFLLYNNVLSQPIQPEEIAGGQGMVEAIEHYEKYERPQLLGYVKRLGEYHVNPPNEYYTDSLGRVHMLREPWALPKGIESYSVEVSFSRDLGAKASGKGRYIGYPWDCADSSTKGESLLMGIAPLYHEDE